MSRYYSVLVITVVVINGLHCTLICLVFLIPFFKIIILYNNCTYSVIVGLCILVFCSVLLRGVLFSFLFVFCRCCFVVVFVCFTDFESVFSFLLFVLASVHVAVVVFGFCNNNNSFKSAPHEEMRSSRRCTLQTNPIQLSLLPAHYKQHKERRIQFDTTDKSVYAYNNIRVYIQQHPCIHSTTSVYTFNNIRVYIQQHPCIHSTTSVYTFNNTHTFPKHAHWNSDSVIFHSFCKHTLGCCCFLFWSSVVVVLSLLCFCLGEVSWLHIFC